MLASQVLDGGAHPNGAKIADPPVQLAAVASRQRLGSTPWPRSRIAGSARSSIRRSKSLTGRARSATSNSPMRLRMPRSSCRSATPWTRPSQQTGSTRVAALEFAALPAVVWMECDAASRSMSTPGRRSGTRRPRPSRAIDAELATVLPGVNVDSPAQLMTALAASRHQYPKRAGSDAPRGG